MHSLLLRIVAERLRKTEKGLASSRHPVLYLCQDLFPNGKFDKTISRNAHYIVTFKNPRDQLGIRNLLLQSFPTQLQDVLDTFRKVTQRPFGYLLLDLHPASRDDQRILSHLLIDEGFVRCHELRSSSC